MNSPECRDLPRYLSKLADKGCRPNGDGLLGRFFKFDRYTSVDDVCFAFGQVEGRGVELKAHHFVFSFGPSAVDPHLFLNALWSQYWKQHRVRPFRWYGVHHEYPDDYHIHALLEGWDWDFKKLQFDYAALKSIEATARQIVSQEKC